jgi:proline iminopeptidase
LIAHSNGVNIALDYLGTHPDRVAGLVLLSAPLSFLHSEPFDASLEALVERHRALAETFRNETNRRIESAWDELGLAEAEPLSHRDRSKRRRIEAAGWHTTDPMNWRAMKTAFFEPAVFAALQKNTDPEARRERTLRKSQAFVDARIPIRVIMGDADYVDPEAVVWTGIIQAARDGRLEVLDNAGHNAWIDRPEAFRKVLAEVLEELASAPDSAAADRMLPGPTGMNQ